LGCFGVDRWRGRSHDLAALSDMHFTPGGSVVVPDCVEDLYEDLVHEVAAALDVEGLRKKPPSAILDKMASQLMAAVAILESGWVGQRWADVTVLREMASRWQHLSDASAIVERERR
jgi:hypothetical protein